MVLVSRSCPFVLAPRIICLAFLFGLPWSQMVPVSLSIRVCLLFMCCSSLFILFMVIVLIVLRNPVSDYQGFWCLQIGFFTHLLIENICMEINPGFDFITLLFDLIYSESIILGIIIHYCIVDLC